jgi:hypothetical protein
VEQLAETTAKRVAGEMVQQALANFAAPAQSAAPTITRAKGTARAAGASGS